MKTISNKLSVVLILVLSVVLVVSASPVSMAVGNNSASNAVCTRITTLASTGNATVAAHAASMRADFANRLSNIESRHDDIDQQATTLRASISTQFEAKVGELKKQSGLTAAQLAAIDVYATNMRTAMQTRATAVDAARSTYRTALAAAISTRQQSLIDATTAFEASTAAAFSTATANCADSTAMATLKASIKTARQTMTTTRQANSIGDSIKQLAETRNAAMKTANTTFSTAAATYTAELKTVLNQTITQ